LHTDHLGTPQFATDSDQSVAWTANYQPFGAASTSGAITQNLRLPGQYFDLETGWNHNGFRDYLPELGRYLQPDPLGMQGSGTNLYAYAADDPITNTDPTGCSVVNCSQKIQDLRNAIDNLGRRVAEHAAHGGTKCDKMQHDKAIKQAVNAVNNALAAASSCLTQEEIQEVKDWVGNLYQGAVDNLYQAWTWIYNQFTAPLPKNFPGYGGSTPWVSSTSPILEW
jgi:RHS repeat-associated protein